MTERTRLIAALDTESMEQAQAWTAAFGHEVDAIKLGMEFTYACGFDAVQTVAQGQSLFLDLKLHDIPNTVASGLRALRRISPALTTIHAAGGAEMISRAKDALDEAFDGRPDRPTLLAVTVLTSMGQAGLNDIGVPGTPADQVVRLGKLAIASGADGLVCSAHEITLLRDALGAGPKLVVPGIRPAGSATDDQKRVMTPGEAARAGADWIVVGRPITRAPDPVAAARAIMDELRSA